MIRSTFAVMIALFAVTVSAQNTTQIVGQVESKCVVTTDRAGVYGNPTPDKLTTIAADGGVRPVVRYDVVLADAYRAVISHPNSFSQSPGLVDTLFWTGQTAVEAVSDPLMSDYDNTKIEYDNVTEIDLTFTGSTWFNVESEVTYGVNKSLPGGTYTAVVEASCIAK